MLLQSQKVGLSGAFTYKDKSNIGLLLQQSCRFDQDLQWSVWQKERVRFALSLAAVLRIALPCVQQRNCADHQRNYEHLPHD